MRIVSIVPSLTELLFDINLGNQIIGITRFCIHPKNGVKNICKVGGTKSLNVERIIALKPDLIIANKEENSRSDIELLQEHCNVLLTDIFTLDDALTTISEIGTLTNREKESNILIQEITIEFKLLKSITATNKKVAYLIWNNPIMLAGQNTFINYMLHEINWENILTDKLSRYPQVSDEELKGLNPDYILLSSEPFPFNNTHVESFRLNFPDSKIILVDGEMFSWYGSRMKRAPKYFQQLLLEVDS